VTAGGRVAVVEDDEALLDQLTWALRGHFEVLGARNADEGRALLDQDPEVFLIDLRLPPSNEAEEGLALLRSIRQARPDATVVVMSGETDRRWALKALELGAFDFFQKPLDRGELLLVLKRALERHRILQENRALREEVFRRQSFEELVGSSAGMRRLFAAIEKVAGSDATVLLVGESGTGKELVARSLHRKSPRNGGPFVAVNGSALPETLAESELFGHEKGAFTGAVGAKPGKFELAHHGTLFLDEVSTLAPAVQAKLLRAIETREIERVGGRKPVPVDIRLVAASNEELEARVAAGVFREDLFYRINTVVLRLPALRERLDDLPLLVAFFAARFGERHGRTPKRFSSEVLDLFRSHPWRGNVRELQHLVEMLTLMVDEEEILPDHLPGAFGAKAGVPATGTLPLAEAVARFEKGLLEGAISRANGVKAHAASALGLDANQMKYLCRKYGL
jgi:DNA-binding NtrC family response regulator